MKTSSQPIRAEPTRGEATRFDPTGSRLSDADWMEWARRARRDKPLGMLGAYELLEEIGHGAQGTVYKARQPGTSRVVVIKRLAAGAFATPRMRARFEREIETLSSLNHPQIVTVHAAEVIEGQPILVMEYVEGLPVDRWAEECDRQTGAALYAFAYLCSALAHAHQRAMVHRDLKPSNVLVDSMGRPHVLDFGLATWTAGAETGAKTLTAGFVGTPAYASPEQISGDPGTVDTRSDIYSAGVMLYEALTGVWPFASTGQRTPPASMAEVFDAIRQREPRRPSSLRGDLSAEIDAILLKAIAKAPEARYQSADALADDLRRCMTGEPVQAHPPTTTYQMRKLIQRHRLGFGLGMAIVCVTVIFGIVSATQAFRLARQQRDLIVAQEREREMRVNAEAARSQAETAQKAAEGEAAKVLAANSFLQELLLTRDPQMNLRPNVELRVLLKEAGRTLDGGALAAQPEVEAAVRLTIGRTYMGLRMPRLAEPHLRQAWEIRAERGIEDLELAEAAGELALGLCEQSKFNEGIPLHRLAVELQRDLAPADESAIMRRIWRLATGLRDNNELSEAEALSTEALDIAQRLYGDEHTDTVESRYRVAMALLTSGRNEETIQVLSDVLPRQRRLLGERHPAVAETMLRLGMATFRSGDQEGGLALMRASVALHEEVSGPDHPRTTRATINLARVLESIKRLSDADELYRRSLEQRRRYHDEEDGNSAPTLGEWSRVKLQMGDARTAEALQREALEISLCHFGLRHSTTIRQQANLAELLLELERFAEAEAPLLAARATIEQEEFAYNDRQRVLDVGVQLYHAWQAASPDPERASQLATWDAALGALRELRRFERESSDGIVR